MSDELPRLSRAVLGRVTTADQPTYDPADLAAGIVHLGIGAFHRAHQAVLTDAAPDAVEHGWGIVGVTQRNTDVMDRLKPQDCLFTVVTPADGKPSKRRIVGSVIDVLHAASSPEGLLSALASPTTRVVSTTVTEKGYAAALSSRTLVAEAPLVAQDLLDFRPHRSVVGQLVGGFTRRADAAAPGLTVLCCDNVSRGGELLEKLVGEFLGLWAHPDAEWVRDWVTANVTFPNTLVDRIVTAPTPAEAEQQMRALGYRDEAIVTAEAYGLWVIEDRFRTGHPQWPAEQVQLVNDIGPWSDLKLRLLNGGHSLLAYVGLLDGRRTMAEAMCVPWIAGLLGAWFDEASRSLRTLPVGVDLAAYRDALIARFQNRGMAYQLEKVAADGSLKLPTRVGATAADIVRGGGEAPVAAAILAAWLHYIEHRGGTVDDPKAELLADAVAVMGSSRTLVDKVFAGDGVVPLASPLQGTFLGEVAGRLADLRAHGGLALNTFAS
jgi:fructuronate reductase